MENLTICYTVGGHQVHYDNMLRSIKSIRDHGCNCKILIREFGTKLTSTEDYQVTNLPDEIDFNSGKKVGYLVWRQKYKIALDVMTDYGMYLDSDTVMANNNLPQIIEMLQDGIAVTQHFWVPTIGSYQQRVATGPSGYPSEEFMTVKTMIGATDSTPFFAGGAFIWANNDKNRNIFLQVLEWYDDYYNDEKGYTKSITDELFLAGAVQEYTGKKLFLGGGFNHCSMGEEYMPMTIKDSVLYGRNPYENYWSPITILHCDISRRDPSEHYSGEMAKIIRQKFYMETP
tara:strand:+ start:478 stop:1338 length:861 start_codon:yes stop_codon:yes gene_type:complete